MNRHYYDAAGGQKDETGARSGPLPGRPPECGRVNYCSTLAGPVGPVADAVPFGLSAPAVLALFEAAWEGNVAGVSVTEFDPGRDARDASLNLLGWLVEYVLLKAAARAP